MADIYKRQVQMQRKPSELDTAPMKYFDKKREEGGNLIQANAEFWQKKQEAEEKSVVTNLEKGANQVYKNAYTLYGHDPKEYKKFVKEGLDKLYTAVPDGRAKRQAMANVSITGSGYDTRVEKNWMDDQEMRRNAQYKDAMFMQVDNAKAGLSGLFAMQDENLSPEQRLAQAESFRDAQIPLMRAYKSRYAQDSNGNFIYSSAERATLADAWENRGRYALLDYAGDNITTNRKGVVTLRSGLVENKDTVMEAYDISEEQFAKTLDDMDKIIAGQSTAQDLMKAESMQVVNKAVVKDMKIEPDGKVGNKEYNNIDTMVGVFETLKGSEREGAYASKADRLKIAEEKGKVARAIIYGIEEEVDLKHDRNWLQKTFKVRPNVGETAVMHVNKNIDKLSQTMAFQNLDKDEQDAIKADMYVQVLGGLQKAENISLKDKDNPQAMEIAKATATDAYYRQIEGIVGGKPYVKNPDDPQSVRMAYEDALFQRNNEMAMSNIKYQLGIN